MSGRRTFDDWWDGLSTPKRLSIGVSVWAAFFLSELDGFIFWPAFGLYFVVWLLWITNGFHRKSSLKKTQLPQTAKGPPPPPPPAPPTTPPLPPRS